MLKKWTDSLNYAIEGVLHAAQTQKHVRLHFIVIMLLLLVCFAIGMNKRDFIVVSLIATVVIVAEVLNSAIETVVDMISPHRSEKARIAKDMAAGAVLISAISSFITAFYIILPYITRFRKRGYVIATHETGDIALCSVILVIILVIMLKSLFGFGHPLRGGMPSGHTAIAFSLFVTSLHAFDAYYGPLVVLILALGIAVSRVVSKIHSPVEVFAGGLLGSLITWGMFMIFR